MEQKMEPEGASGYCRMSEDNVIKHSKLWRDGPASHIYDQLGIPEDCKHLDYNVVLQPVAVWDPPHIEAEKQRLLELAVQSITTDDENKDLMKDSWYSTPFLVEDNNAQHECSPAQCQRQYDSTDSVFSNSFHATFCNRESEFSPESSSLDECRRLKLLVSKVEDSKAVATLIQKMDDDWGKNEASFSYDQSVMNTGKVGTPSNENNDSKKDDDSYSLVSQIQWEDDIIWDADNIKMDSISRERQLRAGWIPSQEKRTAPIATENKPDAFISMFSYENEELVGGNWENEIIWNANDFQHQIHSPKLPVYDVADDDIIFKMPKELLPLTEISDGPQQQKVVQKKNQPHAIKSKLLLGKTGFIQLTQEQKEQQARQEEEKSLSAFNRTEKKSSLNYKFSSAKFNISNDEFYQPKMKDSADAESYNCRHSRLVKLFVPPFIQTHLNTDQLQHFHRPKLSAAVNVAKVRAKNSNLHFFKSLTKRAKAKFEEHENMIAQGQPILFDKESDLSGRDGTIILIENSEEHPPLLSQVGMCSQIVNYYKRKSLREEEYAPPVGHEFGETSYVSNSSFPFLGTLQSGQVLSGIRNNMYNSPIYWQGKVETDFLVIHTKLSGYMIRELDGMFTAGQQCPLIEVPEPNSIKARNILKELIDTFVLRKYLACPIPATTPRARATSNSSRSIKDTPKVRMDEITRHFPTVHETTIKAILKNSSDLQRIGRVSWMVKKKEFVLPSEEDLAGRISPEDVCAYYSLLAAEQRLRDAGLGSMLALHEHGGAENVDGKKSSKNPLSTHSSSVFDEELLSAPWNTTSAFIAAKKGKCLLQVTGPADPTGCGEGYSYVRVAKRGGAGASGILPGVNNAGGEEPVPHCSGRGGPRKYPLKTANADLRKLSTKTGKQLLRKSGIPEKEIAKLSRWEVVDLVRTLSTEKVMQGESIDKAISKFCSWKKIHSTAMNQERYKEACQNVFELQNKVLSSREDLSTDDDDSEEDTEFECGARVSGASKDDIEQMGRQIERILSGDADINKITHEEEESERLELQKMMLGGVLAKDADMAKRKANLEQEKELAQKSKESSEDILSDLMKNPGKKLKITRTYKYNNETVTQTETEIVQDPVVIAAYLRIRNSRSEEFIKEFLDKAERREKKEKKQMERILLSERKEIEEVEKRKMMKSLAKKRREMEDEDEYFPTKEAQKKAQKALKPAKVKKCGACGRLGHNKTSRECPMYNAGKFNVENNFDHNNSIM